MKTLNELCVPRESVFDSSRRDTVLDLTDFLQDKVKAEDFFAENFMTEGMKILLQKAFERLEGKSDQGIFLLTQAMGGGKTHNLFALGLLAKYPAIRRHVLKGIYSNVSDQSVRVVAFSGREVDAPYGIWGAIAEQLNKKEFLKDYYSPLSAPGQSAWVNLLKGDPVLILLDELPVYFENAKSISIGDSNLANVTTSALSNLFVAIAKEDLKNVCLVLTDLKAAWKGGSERINEALENLNKEAPRYALPLEPVRMNTNEVYHILRTRLFERTPGKEEVKEIAEAYRKALADAVQMDLSSENPEQLSSAILESYPFHPGIKNLYARFKENDGFQQTRGLIRLMRAVVSLLFSPNGKAKDKYLISAYDIDLNNATLCSEIKGINPHLTNAISHDIADDGRAVAEELDKSKHSSNIQDASKCWLVSSLANVPNAVVGLTDSELVYYLAAPNRDLSHLREEISLLTSRAWYLHTSRERRRYFKNVENLNAKLRAQAESFPKESRIKEIRSYIEKFFKPQLKDCYEELVVLPSLDEIEVKQDRVILVVIEPHKKDIISDELKRFWSDLQFKNRIMFLTGQSDTMASVYNAAAEVRSIHSIIEGFKSQKMSSSDPQMIEAQELCDKLELHFRSAIRETFTTIIYPHRDDLRVADFRMDFESNNYNGEKQIRKLLLERQKFTDDVSSDSFRKKCEQRLFTQKEMPWADILRKAATNTEWQWHKPDALELLKNESVSKDYWHENGNYIEKGPFPPPASDVIIRVKHRDDNTGEVTLQISPVRGDQVFYRDPSLSNEFTPVEDYQVFKTSAIKLEFYCEDSTKKHSKGDVKTWSNTITIKSDIYQDGNKKMCELKAFPKASIKYTLDGSDPKDGKPYTAPFEVPLESPIVQAIAERDGVFSEVYQKDIDWSNDPRNLEIDRALPYLLKKKLKRESTNESFKLLDLLEKYNADLIDPIIDISQANKWIRLEMGGQLKVSASKLKAIIQSLRSEILQGEVHVTIPSESFKWGGQLQDLVRDLKEELKPEEIEKIKEAA